MKLSQVILKLIGRVVDAQSKLGCKPDPDADYYVIVDQHGNMLDHYDDMFKAMEYAELYSKANNRIEVVHKGMTTAIYQNGKDIG